MSAINASQIPDSAFASLEALTFWCLETLNSIYRGKQYLEVASVGPIEYFTGAYLPTDDGGFHYLGKFSFPMDELRYKTESVLPYETCLEIGDVTIPPGFLKLA